MNREKSLPIKIENSSLRIRIAVDSDAAEIASVFKIARHHNLPYLRDLHTPEEDVEYVREKVFKEDHVLIVDDSRKVVGFCAFKKGWLEHLYILPEFQGKGVGKLLLDKAKAENSELQLWVFQKNTEAIKFYEKNGFSLIETTDGSANEEREPDARYLWSKEEAN